MFLLDTNTSIALSANATLVTNNTREFKRVKGLSLADWSTKETPRT